MVQAHTPSTRQPKPTPSRKRRAATASESESSLLLVRLKELDREFARQTKQLTALTKKLGKKLTKLGNDNT